MQEQRIQQYRVQDAKSNLWGLVFLSAFLGFCLIAPDISNVHFDYHLITLVAQIMLLVIFLRSDHLPNKSTLAVLFFAIMVSTVHESYIWAKGLSGVIVGGEHGKGAWAAFLFQSPPYLYPLIRVGGLALFLPLIMAIFFPQNNKPSPR
ncbi:hypothetical protein [Lewinella sp. W8]|uniref:hypothetical protein n=1 Tax=Lewinella sp. W8 TaxID=2528208 RepID=UPI0010689A5C|nr:hypothetical protein [Lewinella sp. W8]MTB51736.1 hypothetical protein [Lewinella sp. W8]